MDQLISKAMFDSSNPMLMLPVSSLLPVQGD